jgi:hypothetical protein
MFVIGSRGQMRIVFLGGAVNRGTKIRFFLS